MAVLFLSVQDFVWFKIFVSPESVQGKVKFFALIY